MNSKKKQTAGSKWAKGHNGLLLFTQLKESKWGKDHYGLLLFTPWQSETSSEQQERNKQQGQNGQRVKMGFCYLPLKESKWGCCCLPPSRVKLTVNSKKETNSRVKMGKESKWGKGHYGLLLFTYTPDRVKLPVNSKKETNGKVKIGFCYLPPWKVKMGER